MVEEGRKRMKKKAQLNVGVIITMIIAVVAGLVLIQAIFDQQALSTTKTTVTDESINIAGAYDGGAVNTSYEFTVTNAPSGWQLQECPLTSVTLTNSSGSSWTTVTDYVFNTTDGTFTLKNTANVNQTFDSNNLTYVDYTYCQDGYNNDSGSRAIAGLIGLFCALALLAFIIVKGMKDWF